MKAWRITQRRHAATAFTGEGARLFGGRWNQVGTPMVYTAESRSLAMLEVLVHLDSPALLDHYVFLEATFEPSLVTTLDRASLPRNWQSDPPPHALQIIGDAWAASGTSAILQIPSALVPEESNFLIHPRHADFAKITFTRPQAFRFDPRLAHRR